MRRERRDRLNNLYDDVDTPLLILVAGADDQAPPASCTEKAEALALPGHSARLRHDEHGHDGTREAISIGMTPR